MAARNSVSMLPAEVRGGRVSSQVFGTATTTPPRMNLLRIEEELSAAHLRLARTYVEHLDWKTCIQKYDCPHTLFYADPPYWQTEGYGVPFPFEEYQALAEVMRSCKGKVILSINDHPDMRDVFAGFRMEQVAIQYSVNQNKGKASAELIICSW